jgi:hypothetical protein
MFKIVGENYYIDIDAVDECVQFTEKVPVDDIEDDETQMKEEKQIHLVKYELIKSMIETVLTENEEVDETMAFKSSELTIPFKIAFNSLLVKSIIKKM